MGCGSSAACCRPCGCCHGSKSTSVGRKYRLNKKTLPIMKETIFGNLMYEDDWAEFAAITSVRKHSSITGSATYPISVESVSFLVCLEGEIILSISDLDTGSLPTPVKTFLPGDVVHLFPYEAIVHSEKSDTKYLAYQIAGSLVFGKYRLMYSCRTVNRRASYAVLETRPLQQFLMDHIHLSILDKLANFDICANCLSAFDFEGLGKEQMNVLARVMDIKVSFQGDLILRSLSAEFEINGASPQNYVKPKRYSGIILVGKFVIMESGISPEDFIKLRAQVSQGSSKQPGTKKRMLVEEFAAPPNNTAARSMSSKVASASATVSHVVESCQVFRTQQKVYPTNIENITIDEYVAFLKPGSVVGMEHIMLPKAANSGGLSSVVCCGDGLVGQFNSQVIHELAKIDPVFWNTLFYNFCEGLIESVHASVPLFKELSYSGRRALAKKIDVRFYEPGKPVYKVGEKGSNFFVVLRGAVEEYIQEARSDDMVGAPGALYLPGQYFGEQCMVSGTTYPSTMTCVEPTLVLAINDVVYRSVFTNKNKLAEINIRLLGPKVELEDILMHQKGYELLHRFVSAEHSGENLAFWTGVDRFEEMCTLLERQSDPKDKAQAVQVSTVPPSVANTADEVQAFSEDNELVVTPSAPSKQKAAEQALLQHVQGHPHRHHHEYGQNSVSENEQGWIGQTAGLVPSYATGLRGLLDYGQKIVDNHIRENSPECVNIPGLMRAETLDKFTRWAQDVQRLLSSLTVPSKVDSSRSIQEQQVRLNSNAKNIFVATKREIYNLLKKDSYMRFRGTMEFVNFIGSIQPFSKQDTSVARKSSNSSRFYRTSNRSVMSKKAF